MSDRSQPPVLALQGVDVGYPGAPEVLDHATVEVRAGRRIAVLGANGSGKTTLLRTLAGALRPTAGQVLWHGKPLQHRRSRLNEHRQRVQFVGQDPDDQLVSADVRRDVSFGPTNLGLPAPEVRARVEEALALLDLLPLADRPVHHLSYGQRKRVALAGAMAMRPAVMLLDEPTAGVDDVGVRDALDALARLERAGTTVVVSTHDSDLAWAWADDVVLLQQGGIRQGSCAEVMSDADALTASRVAVPAVVRVGAALGLDLLADNRPRTADDLVGLVHARG